MALPTHPFLVTLQLPLLCLTNCVALAVSPKHQILRVGLSLPVIFLLISQSLHRVWEGQWGHLYAMECAVLLVFFKYVDWVLLARPDKEGWYKILYGKAVKSEEVEVRVRANGHGHANGIGHTNGNKSLVKRSGGEEGAPQGFWARLWWAMRLSTTTRYVGWSCEVKNVKIEVSPEYSRLLFIARKALRMGLFYFLQDIIYSYTASSPHGSWQDIKLLKPVVGFESYPFLHRLSFTWIHIVLTYISLEYSNAGYGIVSVATGLANPRDCPSMFGDLKELYSVRKAWSSVWHQQCRRICSTPGIFIARDVLQLRKSSFASKYFQLFIGFGISAVVHSGASMLVHRSFEDDFAFECFIAQAFLILIEDHIIDFGKSLGLKNSIFWRVIGFVWTVCVIGATMERWTGSVISHGIWIHNREVDWLGIGPKV